jgi:hypothetical protein
MRVRDDVSGLALDAFRASRRRLDDGEESGKAGKRDQRTVTDLATVSECSKYQGRFSRIRSGTTIDPVRTFEERSG